MISRFTFHVSSQTSKDATQSVTYPPFDPTLATRPLPAPLYGGYHLDLIASGTVTFVLYAPFKPFVSLVGDFNGWHSRANLMVTNGAGLWWTTVPHPGPTRYGFYVAVDDQSHVWTADPYATEIRWDESGPWAWLPDEATLRERRAFPWQDEGWRTPPLSELVIYELGVRDFTGRWRENRPVYGTFAGVESKLDYLAELGVNAIELMPIQQFPGESSWGYNPVFYFAPARVYGGPEDVKRLVDACHRRGLAVILDIVPNHAWGDHPWYQMFPPMYGPKGEKLEDLNPFFHHTPDAVNMWGGVDWDHFATETTRYFQAVARHWLREYHIDGFRFDWVGGVDYDSRNPMQPGFNPYHGIAALCWAARQAKPDVLLIGEYWPLDGTHPDKTPAKLVAETEMDAVWNGEFHHTLEAVLKQGWEWEKKDIRRAIGGYREQGFNRPEQVINYTASHDEVRPVHEILYYARRHITKPDGYTWLEVALDKALVGLVALFSAPGVPMLYAGQEFGEDTPRTVDFLPIDWSKLEIPLHRRHWEVVRRLIRARKSSPALAGPHIEFLMDDFARTNVVRYRRWAQWDEVALVALNFGDQPRATTLPFPDNSRWWEVITDSPLHVTDDSRRALLLPPWQGRVFLPSGA